MLKPIEFEGHNIVLAKDQKEYQPLPAFYDRQSPYGHMLTCWELTDEDIEKLKESKRIWVSQMTFHKPFQPLIVCADQAELFTVQKPEEES